MTPWTSKVLKIKEQFSSLLKVDDIDPLTIKGVQQYIGDPKNANKINKDGEQQKEIERIASMIKYGKPHGLTGSPFKDTGMLRIITRGNSFMGPVFKLDSKVSTYTVYKYIGYLNLDKIVEGSETSLKLLVDNSTVLKFWEGTKYGSIVPFLPKNKEKSLSGSDLAGIYFLINSITSTSSGDSKDIKIKILYVYVSGSKGTINVRSIPSFELYSLDDNNKLNKIDPATKTLNDVDSYSLGLGGTYEIDSPIKDEYKTTINHIEPKFSNFVIQFK